MRCGPRLIQSIAECIGVGALDDERANSLCRLGTDGTSPDGMLHAFRELGLQRAEIKSDVELGEVYHWLETGAIVAVCWCDGSTSTDGHWVTVVHVNGKIVLLHDADLGTYRAVPTDYFQLHWLDYTVEDGEYLLYSRCAVFGWPVKERERVY